MLWKACLQAIKWTGSPLCWCNPRIIITDDLKLKHSQHRHLLTEVTKYIILEIEMILLNLQWKNCWALLRLSRYTFHLPRALEAGKLPQSHLSASDSDFNSHFILLLLNSPCFVFVLEGIDYLADPSNAFVDHSSRKDQERNCCQNAFLQDTSTEAEAVPGGTPVFIYHSSKWYPLLCAHSGMVKTHSTLFLLHHIHANNWDLSAPV